MGVHYLGSPTASQYPGAQNQIMFVPLNGEEHFIKCTFKYDNNFITYNPSGNAIPTLMAKHNHLRAEDVHGLRVLGCTFIDTRTGTDVVRNTVGVYASNADITIQNEYTTSSLSIWKAGIGTETHPSTFNNMLIAIVVSNIEDTKRVVIKGNTLTKNDGGILVDGTQKAIITHNNIHIAKAQENGQVPLHELDNPNSRTNVGINIAYSTGFIIEENNIIGTLGANTIGIRAAENGPNYNDIYHNTITNTTYAMYAEGLNFDDTYMNDYNGLKFLCNTAATSYYDITVTGNRPFSGVGISIEQRNRVGWGMIYPNLERSAANTFGSKPTASQPVNFNNCSNCNEVNYYYYGTANHTNPQFPYKRTPNVYPSAVSNFTCNPRNYNPKPLIAVPIAARLTELGEIEGLIATAEAEMASADDSSYVGYLYENHAGAVDSMLYLYMYDDTADIRYDSLAYILEHVNLGYNYKLMLAGVYNSMLRFDDAIAVLEMVKENYALPEAVNNRIDNMIIMYGILKNLHQNGNNWEALEATERDQVWAMLEADNYYAYAIVRMLLGRFEGQYYLPTAPVPEDLEIDFAAAKGNLLQAENIRIFPTPTTGSLITDWQPAQNSNKAVLTLTDMTGRLMLKTTLESDRNALSLQGYAAGIYSAVVTENGKTIHQQKIVKQ